MMSSIVGGSGWEDKVRDAILLHKILVVALAILAPLTAKAQSLADKQRCYEQSKKYVADVRQTSHVKYEWMAAHYDGHVCYVEYGSFENGGTIISKSVDDAFEGTNYAWLIRSLPNPPSVCVAFGKECKTEPQFDNLVSAQFGSRK